jgi:flagellar hook-basal body complex protein FliE
MSDAMGIDAIAPLSATGPTLLTRPAPSAFADAMGSAADALSGALTRADALAAGVALGKTDIAEAAIARAKADVMLEVAAIAASRISGAIATLMQTQV